MDGPDITRRQVVDRLFYDYGFNVSYQPGAVPHPGVPTTGTRFCGLD